MLVCICLLNQLDFGSGWQGTNNINKDSEKDLVNIRLVEMIWSFSFTNSLKTNEKNSQMMVELINNLLYKNDGPPANSKRDT